MGEHYYLAIDERNDVTIHQYEPHYNHLHGKWKSMNGGTYVSKNLINLLISNPIDMTGVKACYYELETIVTSNNKLTARNVYKLNR